MYVVAYCNGASNSSRKTFNDFAEAVECYNSCCAKYDYVTIANCENGMILKQFARAENGERVTIS